MPKPARAVKKESTLQGKIKSDFPKHTLEEALRVAQALEDANAGQPLPPLETAEALKMSPGSSDFRAILSSSIKYGLTSGSFNSERVSLEETGRDIVEATSEESKPVALVQAALTPPTFRAIWQHFKGKKLPETVLFQNAVVREFGVPREHAERCVQIFMGNMEFVGLIKSLPTGKWLSTDAAAPVEKLEPEEEVAKITEPQAHPGAAPAPARPPVRPVDVSPEARLKVFIAHGKNPQIVTQLKDLLKFGNFDPVVAEEYETTARPIPDKVIGLMRECSAGVIHVASEEELLDKAGGVHHRLNENVLIEIGAALALYGRKFILLVEKSLHLPSNLSGLYCCFYEGDKLDYDATMKLLKAFSEFREPSGVSRAVAVSSR